jgi:hypothetical protein
VVTPPRKGCVGDSDPRIGGAWKRGGEVFAEDKRRSFEMAAIIGLCGLQEVLLGWNSIFFLEMGFFCKSFTLLLLRLCLELIKLIVIQLTNYYLYLAG